MTKQAIHSVMNSICCMLQTCKATIQRMSAERRAQDSQVITLQNQLTDLLQVRDRPSETTAQRCIRFAAWFLTRLHVCLSFPLLA